MYFADYTLTIRVLKNKWTKKNSHAYYGLPTHLPHYHHNTKFTLTDAFKANFVPKINETIFKKMNVVSNQIIGFHSEIV